MGQFAPQSDPIVDEVMSNGQSDAFASTGDGEDSDSINELMGIPGEAQDTPVTPQPDSVSTPNNEEVRYQYWQSQADKAKNDLTGMREQNALLQNQLNIMSSVQQPQVQAQEVESEEFPPPPERPMKPNQFSREEAYTDPQSESAQYLDSMEDWRDTMDEYNQLSTQYQTELAKAERMDLAEQHAQHDAIREAQRQEYNQLNTMASYVKQKYNASDDDIRGFYDKFSSDESITVDNLWQLYQFNRGGAVQAPPNQPGSPAFSQTKRAQQVASPMGVVSGANTGAQGSAEDKIMDSMVSNYKSKNPF